MTKEEILAMEVGEKLDAFVAEIVMGIQGWFKYSTGYHPKAYPYSTDISAAWQVVEKEGAWDIKKRFRPHPDDPAGSGGRPTYQATVFLSDYDPYEDALINKRTGRSPWYWQLPEAICKAALLAKHSTKSI